MAPPLEGEPVAAVDVEVDELSLPGPLLDVVVVDPVVPAGAPVTWAPGTVVPKVTARSSMESVAVTAVPSSSTPEQTAFPPSKAH
jgi:hypothetical protein